MTLAHWCYLAGIVLLILTVVFRRNVVPLAIVATLVTAWAFTGSLVDGLATIFTANLTAATELFTIFLIIGLMTAMLSALRSLGADRLMIRPFQRLMRNGHVAYAVVAVVCYALSLAFWPTPVIALIGALLIPAALRVGLTPLGCALAVAITGQGMALASDYVMGVAPSLSAQGAGVPASAIADRALVISLVAGVVALVLAYLRDVRRSVGTALDTVEHVAAPASVAPGRPAPESGSPASAGVPAGSREAPAPAVREETDVPVRRLAAPFAIAVPLAFAAVLGYLLLARFTSWVPEVGDGMGAPLVGGTAAVTLLAVCCATDRRTWMERSCEHFVEGLTFAVKTMAMVIPVAGFVYLGLSDFSGSIFGLDDAEAPAFLIDALSGVQPHIPDGTFFAVFAMLLIGMIIGLDGSGWPGLPFTGSLAAGLAESSGTDAATLAAIAQNGATWTGGGTLVIWSSLIVVAGITGVSVTHLARRLFLPVVGGLVVATAFAGVLL